MFLPDFNNVVTPRILKQSLYNVSALFKTRVAETIPILFYSF